MISSNIPSSGGIYRITCIVTGKIYVGSAKNLQVRCRSHIGDLRRNTHGNSKLQYAWAKYGPDAFTFDILELVLIPELLIPREQYWLDTLKPFDENGFNIDRFAGSTRLGYTFTPESRAKMSASHQGQVGHNRGKKASDETRAKQRAAKLGKPGARINYKASPETLAKMSASRKGKPNPHDGVKRTPEARAKIAAAGLGRRHTPETIERLRVTKIGNTNGARSYIVTSPEGVEYTVHGLKKFCEERGLIYQALGQVALGKRRHHKGWIARSA